MEERVKRSILHPSATPDLRPGLASDYSVCYANLYNPYSPILHLDSALRLLFSVPIYMPLCLRSRILQGRVMSRTVSHRPLTAQARDLSPASPYAICDGESKGFTPSTSGFLVSVSFQQYPSSHLIHLLSTPHNITHWQRS